MPKNKSALTLLLILLCVGGILLFRALKPDPEALLKKWTAERSLGDAKAPLWITEYFDYQCPPCGTAYKTLEDAMNQYPGKIYLQVRYFPLPAHKNSMKAAIHAECASRQKDMFWKFHGQLFQHQGEWVAENYPELKFLQYAQETKLDLGPWDACTKDPAIEQAVAEEKKKGESLGVKITPSFFINGKLAVGTGGLNEELKKLENKDVAAS